MMTLTTRPMSFDRGARRALLAACALAVAVALPARGAAQCGGDCDGAGGVAINELITAVDISLGSASITTCEAADANSNGAVTIDELVAAVNHALNGCPPGGECGNEIVELDQGETCDDGNTDDTDTCPANCRVRTCTPSGEKLSMTFDFRTVDTELLLQGMTVFLRYPDGIVSIPGAGDAPPVQQAVQSDIFSLTLNDVDFGLNSVMLDPFMLGYSDETAFTVEFDLCTGATRPSASAFSCLVRDGVDLDFNSIPGDEIDCELVILP